MNRAQRRYGAGRNHEKTRKYNTYYSRDYLSTPAQRKAKPRLCMRNRCCAVSSKDLIILKNDIKLAAKQSPGPKSTIMKDECKDTTKSRKITNNAKNKSNVKSPGPSLKSYEPFESHPVEVLVSTKSKRSFYSQTDTEQYQSLLREQFGFNPSSSEKLIQMEYILKAKKFVQISPSTKTEATNTCRDGAGLPWHEVDNVDDVDSLINKMTPPKPCLSQKTVHIAKTPRVKVIAEKYFKYKKNGVELRKLLERIACLEYDIYEDETTMKPMQVMRLYFLMKPIAIKMFGELAEKERNPSEAFIQMLKHECNVPDAELIDEHNFKQVEVIDGHVCPNRTYIDDLKKVISRNRQISRKKVKSSLDLQELYEAAKNDKPILDSMVSQTFLSKGQMQEVKELITTCMLEGINTRNIQHNNDKSLDKLIVSLVSKSVVHELYTESGISSSKLTS